MAYAGKDVPQLLDRSQDGHPLFRVEAHGREFVLRERLRLFQKRLDDPDLADIVEKPSEAHPFDHGFVEAHLFCDGGRAVHDPL